MNATARKYEPQGSSNYSDQYQASADTDHLRKLMRRDIAGFYNRISVTGKRILAALIQAAPTMNEPFTYVVTKLQFPARCSKLSVLRTIPRGEEAGLFSRVDHESGRRHGSIITLYKERCEFFLSLYKQEYGLLLDTKHDRYPVTNAVLAAKQAVKPYQSKAEGNSVPQPDTNADRYKNPVLLDRQIKNLSGSEENEEERWARRLLSISTDEFQILWPRLHDERFGPDQIRQIIQHRLSFNETILDIENSLHAAEWELEHETFPEARKGHCNYLFATLKNKGTWRRPVGFLTPNEQALANAKKEKAIIRELQELDKKKSKEADMAARDEKFEVWLAEQTPEELQEIDELCSMPISTEATKRSWRKSYWNKNINRNATRNQGARHVSFRSGQGKAGTARIKI